MVFHNAEVPCLRQIVTAPLRAYSPVVSFLGVPFIGLLISEAGNGLDGLLVYVTMFVILTTIGAFFWSVFINLVICITEDSLVVRDHHYPLAEIGACHIAEAPAEVRDGRVRHQVGQHVFYLVPYKTDRLVQVTLANGGTVSFSADYPDAVCAYLQTRCQNLA